MITDEVVVRIGDPDAGWCLVSVEETPRSLCPHDQIVCDFVPLLHSIFDEDCVTFSIESKVVVQCKIFGAMDSEGSVEGIMDSISCGIRFLYLTDQVEMDWISSLFESLSDIVEFGVRQMGLERLISYRVHKDDGTILIRFGVGCISLIFDVSGQKSNLSPHVNLSISICLHSCKMTEFQLLVECEDWFVWVGSIYSGNRSFVGISAVVACGGNGDLLSNLPIHLSADCDCRFIDFGSLFQHCPYWISCHSVDVENTILKTNTLVTKER